jgi:hypothetical protein
MSLKFPNGAVFGISTALAAAVAASVISNANPAVATVPSAVTEGTVLIVLSNWAALNNRVAVAGTGTSTTAPLEGIDTTDVTLFPTGEGAGSLIAATTFVDFSQQGDMSTSGGDQQFWSGQLLEDKSGRQIQIPTFRNAKVYTLPLYYDPSLPWYAAAKAADQKKEPIVLRCRLPDGDTLYYYGYLSFDGDPSIAMNNPMGNTMTFTALSSPTLIEAA